MTEETNNQKESKEEPQKLPKPAQEKAPAKPQPPAEKKQRPKECVSCGKNIDKLWYYREDNYYCGKGCWKKAKKKAAAAPEKKT